MSDDLGFTIDTTASGGGNGAIVDVDSISYLSTELWSTMPECHYLRICLVEKLDDKNGNRYLSLIFVSKDESFKVRENYFQPEISAKPLVKGLGLPVASKISDLLGKWVWCRLGVRTHGDRAYVTIKAYYTEEPTDNTVAGNNELSTNDGVPF